MTTDSSKPSVLDQQYLPTRAKILEVAAVLDRIDRSSLDSEDDRRLLDLRNGLELLLRHDGDRAEQVQLLFSRPYDDRWREEMQL